MIQKWWVTLILLPFVFFSMQQVWQALTFNIFFSISYEFPFPYNIVNFFLRNFDLIVHEAGHTFFSIFGNRFLTILGGSIYQVLLPAIIVAFTWFNSYKKGMQLALIYLGFSWMSVAMYAADGAERQLPLIADLGQESHDWYNILIHLNMLENHMSFAFTFAFIGAGSYLSGLILPLFQREYKQVELDLKL